MFDKDLLSPDMRHSPCDKQQLAKTLGLRKGYLYLYTYGYSNANRQINNMAKSTRPSQRSKVTVSSDFVFVLRCNQNCIH